MFIDIASWQYDMEMEGMEGHKNGKFTTTKPQSTDSNLTVADFIA